jgi:transposase-like protein
MGRTYEIAGRGDSRALEAFLAKEGQFLLPVVQLIEEAELAVDELIDVTGRATIQAVLQMSAEQVVGPKRRGKRDEARSVHWYGSQPGVVSLSNRKLRVRKPRLREKGRGEGGEVGVPAYEAMRSDRGLGERMLEILLAGVSTRKYGVVVPEMAETVGISKSSVSRETIEAGERKLRELAERRFDDRDILIIYLDGIELGAHHVIGAVGVDSDCSSSWWSAG